MTATEAQAIRKNISYMTDINGQKTGVYFNLRNKQTQDLFEDLFDTLILVERKEEIARPFEEFKKETLDKRKAKA
jgi:hypothetical protein